MGGNLAQHGLAEGPEAIISMREFITKNDRARFRWVEEEIEEATSKEQEEPADHLRLRNHVKLKYKPNNAFLNPLESIERLGSGKNTRVYKSYYAHPDSNYRRPVAVKILDCLTSPEVPIDQALLEVEIMEQLVHPHVVTYVASYEIEVLDSNDKKMEQILGIVMYPPGQDLSKALANISAQLEQPSVTRLEEIDLNRIQDMFGFFGCLAQTLGFLHTTEVRIKHKDVKPANIIIDHFNQILITDFGLSKRYARPGEESTDGGEVWTSKYAAPEAKTPREHVGYRCDVFSLGCVFLEMVTLMLGVPLKEMNAYINRPYYYQAVPKVHEWLDKILPERQAAGRCGLEEKAQEAIIKILPVIKKMLERNPEDRWHADQLWQYFQPLYEFTRSGKVCMVCNVQDITDLVRRRSGDDSTPIIKWPPRIDTLPPEPVETEDADLRASEGDDEKARPGPKDTQLREQQRTKEGPNGTTITNGSIHHKPRDSLHSDESMLSESWTPPKEPSATQPSPTPNPPIQAVRLAPANTLSLALRDPTKKERKILVFDHEESSARRYKVYIDTTGRFLDERATPLRIQRNLLVHFNSPKQQEGGLAGGELPQSVDLRRQGFRVFWRAFFRRNKHIYVPGTVTMLEEQI